MSKIATFGAGAEKAKAVTETSEWRDLFTPTFATSADVWGVLNVVLTYVTFAAGFIAVLYLIIAGITYITAGGNPDQAKKGQQGVINAVIGIVIIMAAYFIIRVAMNITEGFTA